MRHQTTMKIGLFGLLIMSLLFLTGCFGTFTDWFAPLPAPPHEITADAGDDQTVQIDTLVTLDGSASHNPYYRPLIFQWTQTAGPEVALCDPAAEKPTFTPAETGTYTFQLKVTVGKTVSAPDYVDIFVHTPPTAVITAPVDESTFTYGDPITFHGSATDPEDGTLTDSLVWTSNIDGQIGTGESFTRRSLSRGTHTITLTATDLQGAEGTDSATVTIQGQIAFSSRRDGNMEIYVMNADGTDLRRLTNHLAGDWTPAWSPDGTKIAFASDRDGNAEVYVMNADGTLRRLTNHLAWDWNPAWSPDSRKIAFESNRDGNREIYVMNADETDLRNLTDDLAWDSHPAWSPDGKQIAFTSDRDGNPEVYVMDADGTNLRRLTDTNYPNPAVTPVSRHPTWSPDGTKIAFESNRDGNAGIYVMDADGTDLRRLTNAWDREPAWSPDGTKIAFESNRDGNPEVYVMNADGSNVVRRLANVSGRWPTWSPIVP